jgi:hypothetical protein
VASERIFRDEDGVLWTASEVSTAGGATDRQGRRITPVDGFSSRLLFSSELGVVLMLEPPPNWREAADEELRFWLSSRRRGV